MATSYYDHYNEAVALRNRIIAGQSNERPVMAWAAVCRSCAKANDAFRHEETGVHGRRHQSFLNNLDAIWWVAKAQVETLARRA